MNSFRISYTSHSDLLPDLLETVHQLHADDRIKRLSFSRPGMLPVEVSYRDTDPDRSGKVIDALADANIMDYDVQLVIRHKADGIQRVLGWNLYKNLVVEIISVEKLKAMLPPPPTGVFQTVAERRLDYASR